MVESAKTYVCTPCDFRGISESALNSHKLTRGHADKVGMSPEDFEALVESQYEYVYDTYGKRFKELVFLTRYLALRTHA